MTFLKNNQFPVIIVTASLTLIYFIYMITNFKPLYFQLLLLFSYKWMTLTFIYINLFGFTTIYSSHIIILYIESIMIYTKTWLSRFIFKPANKRTHKKNFFFLLQSVCRFECIHRKNKKWNINTYQILSKPFTGILLIIPQPRFWYCAIPW